MRVAAYQAPYRPYPSEGGVELVLAHLERAQADGVELVCCPEALIGELANETDGDYIEPARVLAAKGAEFLVVPVHGGHRPAKEQAWRARGINVLIARAVENGIPLVDADVAGWQGERVCHGTTAIIDSQGTVVAAAQPLAEELVIADVALAGLRGGIDSELFGRANPAVFGQFGALWS